ncbi:unannotated protein [freshwater metagenome]|uniref:Unannotated protein n=1 Tax=freshwater metagenome TaxID=449393 RepID=A0A6J7EVX9_9ZZZZ
MGRSCSRAACRKIATSTLTYIYSDSVAVLGPLATFAEPHAYDLCADHSIRMSVPRGWSVIKQEPDVTAQGPTHDDLMAIADAVREAGAAPADIQESVTPPLFAEESKEIGRRGHLRAIPNS